MRLASSVRARHTSINAYTPIAGITSWMTHHSSANAALDAKHQVRGLVRSQEVLPTPNRKTGNDTHVVLAHAGEALGGETELGLPDDERRPHVELIESNVTNSTKGGLRITLRPTESGNGRAADAGDAEEETDENDCRGKREQDERSSDGRCVATVPIPLAVRYHFSE